MRPFKHHEKGQGLIEYSLTIVLIAIVVILAIQFLAPTVGNVFTEVGSTMDNVESGDTDGSLSFGPAPNEEPPPSPNDTWLSTWFGY